MQPRILATVSAVSGMLCVLIPPSFYERLINEHDYMYLNPAVVAIILFAWLSFIFGSLTLKASIKNKNITNNNDYTIFRGAHQNSILLIAIMLQSLLLLVTIQKSGIEEVIIYLLGSLQGSIAGLYLHQKFLTDSELFGFGLWPLMPVSTGLLYYVLWEIRHNRIKYASLVSTKIALAISIALLLLCSIISVTRAAFIIMLLGIVTILNTDIATEKKYHSSKHRIISIFIIILAVTIFFVFQIIKGGRPSQQVSGLISNFIGYTYGSYNRLAAILNGTFRLPFNGLMENSLSYLYHIPVFHKILELSLGVARQGGSNRVDYAELGYQKALLDANLNPGYQWVTVYGYSYYDLGLFYVVYFFFYGLLSEYLYECYKRAKISGIVLYPYISASIILWFSFSAFGDEFFILLIISVAIIKLRVKRPRFSESLRSRGSG